MKAIVLAAGRGERMRPLTDSTAKPLLKVGGHALIDYHLRALAAAGVREVIANLSWQSGKLREHLGDGRRFGLSLCFSDEGPVALEAGGGIHRALPWLGPQPFLVVNGDIWTDFPFAALTLPPGALAQLVLVANPDHNPDGDFALGETGQIVQGGARRTYAGIGLYTPELFADCRPGRFPLRPLLDRAAHAGRLTGEAYDGHWFDVGTPARLSRLDRMLARGELTHPALPAAGPR